MLKIEDRMKKRKKGIRIQTQDFNVVRCSLLHVSRVAWKSHLYLDSNSNNPRVTHCFSTQNSKDHPLVAT
ncbi:hypothetical protein LINPERPRIM_LOCUS35481, partial [Linum perenne]